MSPNAARVEARGMVDRARMGAMQEMMTNPAVEQGVVSPGQGMSQSMPEQRPDMMPAPPVPVGA